MHEHPCYASSWEEDCVQSVAQLPGVLWVRTDMCRWNLRVKEGQEGRPSKKPTGIMTNSREIAAELDKRCNCQEETGEEQPHAQLVGGGAPRKAATYTPVFSKAILRGLRRQLQEDGVFFEDRSEELMELDLQCFPQLDAIPEEEEAVFPDAEALPEEPEQETAESGHGGR